MYKPGQFISTPFGRMRVRKIKSGYPSDACRECAMKDYKKCVEFEISYGIRCTHIIPTDCYLEKVY